jgi:hypothetical protein
MSCSCGTDKKTYYSHITLHTQPGESGPPSVAGIPLAQTEISVCTRCGRAKFSIPATDMQKFSRRSA